MDFQKYAMQITMYTRCRNNIVAESDTSLVGEYNKVIVENGGTPIDVSSEISETLSSIDGLISECEKQQNDISTKLDSLNEDISTLKTEICDIQSALSMNNYFTENELAELNNYIFEGSYTDEYVTITDIMSYSEKFAQMKILYDRATLRLNRVSQPTQEFSIDAENFVFVKKFEDWSEQLETGCLINIELEQDDVAQLFLSNITINYDDRTLNMTFGNRFNKFDTKSLFDDMLGDVSKSANTLNYIKEILYPIKNGEFDSMKEALRTSRNLTMNAALASENEEVVIDGSGYTGKKRLEDGTFDPHQVKLTGKTLVFTDDAWESCKVALGEILLGDGSSTYGINAETIIGNMIVGGGLKIIDKDGRELLSVVDGISAKIGDVGVDETVVGKINTVREKADAAIEKTEIYYGISESKKDEPETWMTSTPTAITKDTYLWTKVKTIYVDKTKGENGVEWSSPVCITDVNFKSIKEQYCWSESDTEHPSENDTGWTDEQPNEWDAEKSALWMRSKITWTDDTVSYANYTLANMTKNLCQKYVNLDVRQDGIESRVGAIETDNSNLHTSYSALEQKADSISATIGEISEGETITGKINDIKASADELSINITNICDGITSVGSLKNTTESTDFSFGSDGLIISKISKVGEKQISKFKTTIDDNGMTVTENSSDGTGEDSWADVLTADNQGVLARNLHATTYLIVGDRSRFENYDKDGNKYTGCFWIGG